MKATLEELQAQRAQVAQHLAWLDGKIAQFHAAVQPQQPAHTAPVAPPPVIPTAQSPAQPAPVTDIEPQIEHLLSQPKQGVGTGFKLGCILFTVLGIAAFLFILFVLPRFIYGE